MLMLQNCVKHLLNVELLYNHGHLRSDLYFEGQERAEPAASGRRWDAVDCGLYTVHGEY